jgi:hypothetical protein
MLCLCVRGGLYSALMSMTSTVFDVASSTESSAALTKRDDDGVDTI